jgi:cholesterol oxidase
MTKNNKLGTWEIRYLRHLAEMVRAGRVVTAAGEDAYRPHLARMANPGVPYTRNVIPGYGHIDCIFGADASHDVYPLIRRHLEETG